MENKQLNRRAFCRAIAGAAILPCLGLSSCSSLEPKVFLTGEVVNPPIGCVELLKKSEDGDC